MHIAFWAFAMPEVFVSYSQKERALVEPVIAGLKALGVQVWYDFEIDTGQTFTKVLNEKLGVAKAVLVCWSPNSVQSEWVQSEAEFARGAGNYVPVFVSDCRLLPPFNLSQTENLTRWGGQPDDRAWRKLLARIGGLIGRPNLAAAAALSPTDVAARHAFALPLRPRDKGRDRQALICIRRQSPLTPPPSQTSQPK